MLEASATMESTSGRPWITYDPWVMSVDPNLELLESNPNEMAFNGLDAVDIDLSAISADFTFDHSATDSPFSSTISDIYFLDDLEYTSPTSSMESSPRLLGDVHDPLAADFSQRQTTNLGARSHSVLRMPPMFDDIPLQFPANDVVSAWPLFSTPPMPDQPIFLSGVEIPGSASSAPTFPSTSPVFPCPTCDKIFDAKQKLRQHKRHVHLKPASCGMCGKRFGSTRDLTRHTETHHPEVAASLPAESQRSRCLEPGCGYKGRRDNVIRHCRAKHGKDASRKGQGSPVSGP